MGYGCVSDVWGRVALTRVNKSADLKLHGLLTAQKTHKKIHDLETEKNQKDAVAKEEPVREQQKLFGQNDCKRRLRSALSQSGDWIGIYVRILWMEHCNRPVLKGRLCCLSPVHRPRVCA